jgi:hypothetical protein
MIDAKNIVFFNNIENTTFPINLKDLRNLKNSFNSQTLIITKDPIKFINDNFRDNRISYNDHKYF